MPFIYFGQVWKNLFTQALQKTILPKRFVYLGVLFFSLLSTAYAGTLANKTDLASLLAENMYKTIIGKVVDNQGVTIIGATVLVKGTTRGTVTDIDGSFTINADEGDILMVSYLGFRTVEVVVGQSSDYTIELAAGVELEEVVLVGTRAPNRTNVSSPVPVDVINVSRLSMAAPQTTMNQLLHATTPSFSSNTQTISDGTDHIDPASLRGLGPDQVLVLLNGKRRHTTSLVNVNGTFGRGNVGTDLNAIPTTAIQNLEVLRDGAAAQYGSDAIAGVINLRLKEDVNKLSVNLTTGGNFTSGIGSFGIGNEPENVDGEVFNVGVNYGIPLGSNGGFINFTGEYNQRQPTQRMLDFDGDIFAVYNGVERVASAAGADISALTLEQVQQFAPSVGYISSGDISSINAASSLSDISDVLGADATSSELGARGLTSQDFNMRVGQSGLRGGQFFANMSIPIDDTWELYSYGGLSYREGESGCFYRLPGQDRTTTAIWPNGTVPRINSNISDRSIVTGIRGSLNNWSVDFSNANGSNEFLYRMTETHNATLGVSSPTEFNVGGHKFIQNTSNLDLSQYFEGSDSGIKGVNVAFGLEYRYENYLVEPGVESSYGNFDINGNLVNSVTPDHLLTTDIAGRSRPSGSQCFAGFLPQNFVDARRNSFAGYVDVELDVSDEFLIAGALRAEDYSDFGSTFNWKLASRYSVSPNFNLRGAISTGFRAPSLHQINFNKTATIFTLNDQGVQVPQERGTFANSSRAAKLLGIPQLVEETSTNVSLGFTAKIPDQNLKITIDAYNVSIDDRIILTGAFSAGSDAELLSIFDQAGAGAATFFANAIDTRSRGLDIVVAHSTVIGEKAILRNNFAATFSKTEWKQDISQSDLADDDERVVSNGVKASQLLVNKGLVGTYFNQEARIYTEQSVPRMKLTLSNTLDFNKWSIYLRNTLYGETTEATTADIFDEDLNLRSDASIDPYNTGKVLTDLSVAYQLNENLSLTVGSQNLFDVYPDLVDDAFRSSGRFIFSRRSPQFSFGGRHLFARLVFTLQ